MSDDASPSPVARRNASVPSNGNNRIERSLSGLNDSSRRRSHSPTRRRKRKKSNRKRRNPGLAKKLEFITHLLKSLDTLVFAELSALYYMEYVNCLQSRGRPKLIVEYRCSMLRFILRAVGQYLYLTPKDESFPFVMPAGRIHVLLVAIPNFICMLLHLFASMPTGPDYHRGYLHGGLVIDFVGQKPPSSRLYFLLADLAILAIQSLMLTVHNEREKLRVTLKTFRPLIPEIAQEVLAAPTIEDLDAEERGISREVSGLTAATDDTNDIEMRPLRRSGDEEGSSERADEPPPLTRENTIDESSRSHLSDLLSSGNAILYEFHVLQSMRTASTDLERTAAHSLRTLSYGATMAAIEARRRGASVPIRPMQADRPQ